MSSFSSSAVNPFASSTGLNAEITSNPMSTLIESALPGISSRFTGSSSSIVFIDQNVQDYESLVAGVSKGTEHYILDPSKDAISQMTNTLSGRVGITSVHIVSHGEMGGLKFSGSVVNQGNLSQSAGQLQSWKNVLTNDADILIYGCNVATGKSGQDFVQILSHLTGADVAASDDLTGKGGDWNLEVNTGDISTSLVFNSATRDAYTHSLDTYTVTNTSDDESIVGSLRWAISQANADLLTEDTINFAGIFADGDASNDTIITTDSLIIQGNTIIDAAGAEPVTIRGISTYTLFQIEPDATVTFNSINTFRGGNDYAGGISNMGNLTVNNSTFSEHSGSAIYNIGNLTVNNSTFSNNLVSDGGGIYNEGNLVVNYSTFNGNFATNGGGIANFYNMAVNNSTFNANGGTLGGAVFNGGSVAVATLNNVTFDGNIATSRGGAVYNDGDFNESVYMQGLMTTQFLTYNWNRLVNGTDGATLSLNDATFINNESWGDGGGIYNLGFLTMIGSELDNNVAELHGGGIYNYGNLTMNSSILSSNQGCDGGGIFNLGNLTINSSTLSSNKATAWGSAIANWNSKLTMNSSTLSFDEAENGNDIANAIFSKDSWLTINSSTLVPISGWGNKYL